MISPKELRQYHGLIIGQAAFQARVKKCIADLEGIIIERFDPSVESNEIVIDMDELTPYLRNQEFWRAVSTQTRHAGWSIKRSQDLDGTFITISED